MFFAPECRFFHESPDINPAHTIVRTESVAATHKSSLSEPSVAAKASIKARVRAGMSRFSGKTIQNLAETPIEAAAKSAARAIGTQLGREIIRGVLGTIFGGSKRR